MNKVTVSDGAAAAGLAVERSEYAGKPTLSIRRGGNDKFPFSFGVGKAKMIIACFEEIKSFVADIENAAKVAAAAKKELTGEGIVLATPALSIAQLEAMLAKAKANATTPDQHLAALTKKRK